MLTLQGPFGGMDWRETASAENSCRFSLNVDPSRGYLEAREAQKVVQTTGMPFRARLHLVDRPGLPRRYVLAVGPAAAATPTTLQFCAYDADSFDALGASQNLTAIGAGAETADLRVSFVDTYLPPLSDGAMRPVTLVVLRATTLVFEPLKSEAQLYAVDLSTDAVRTDDDVWPFWTRPPCGGIATLHNGLLWFAGMDVGTQTGLSVALGAGQTDIPEAYVAENSLLQFGPETLVRSDNGDPLGVYGANFFTVPTGERVAGLKSLGEALLVLTNKAAYLMTGYDDTTYELTRVASGCGCSSYASVVTVDTVTYWMGDEGVFAFGGLAAPEVRRITDGISPLWTGKYGPRNVPDGLRARLANVAWPWRISKDKLGLCVGREYHGRDQIWWSLPLASGPWAPLAMPLTLVLDLPTMGWHLYFQYPNGNRTNGSSASCFADAVEYGDNWLCSSGLPALQLSGHGALCDGNSGATPGPTSQALGVPMVWGSQRLYGAGADVSQVRGLWLKLLSRGVPSSLGGSGVGQGDVAVDLPAWFVEGEEGAFDTENCDGAEITNYDQRRTKYAALQLHPQPNALYFLGRAVLGTQRGCGTDFFTAHCDALVTSRAFVVGIVDDPWTNSARGNMTVCASINVDVGSTGKPNQ